MSYYSNNPPKLIPSFVCHVDILGYAQLCQASIKASKSDEFLNTVRTALNEAYGRVRERAQSWDGQSDRFEIKIFTDNIVVGYPITNPDHSYGEDELGYIYDVLSQFQVGLAMAGFLLITCKMPLLLSLMALCSVMFSLNISKRWLMV